MTTGPKDSSFRTGASAALRGRQRRFHSLASRLVALGVGQLVLLALTATVIFLPKARTSRRSRGQAHAGDRGPARALVDAPAALSDALDQLRAERIEVSLYDEATS